MSSNVIKRCFLLAYITMSSNVIKRCFLLAYITAMSCFCVFQACGQRIAPGQINPAAAGRVSRPDLPYKLQSNPASGGYFRYVVDTPSVATGGGGGAASIPNWQQVTDVGKTTTHFVTASGLTLTQLASGADVDSVIVVKDGVLKRYPRVTPIVHTFFHVTNNENTGTRSLSENPVQISSNLGIAPLINAQLTSWQERFKDVRLDGFREIMKDTQAFRLPTAPTDKMAFDVLVQSNIRKLEFVGSATYKVDTMTQRRFQNVRHGSVFRCQLFSHPTDGGQRWFIWQVSSPDKRTDTVDISPNRVIELNEIQKHVFLSTRSGTWQAGDGVEFRLPKFPEHGQEIVLTSQFIIPTNMEFRFMATGGYVFRFANGVSNTFAYDPLGTNTTATHTFVNMDAQFRCVANSVNKVWACFVQSQ